MPSLSLVMELWWWMKVVVLFFFVFCLSIYVFLRGIFKGRTETASLFPRSKAREFCACLKSKLYLRVINNSNYINNKINNVLWKESLSWNNAHYWYWKWWSWGEKSCLMVSEDLDPMLKSIRLQLEIQIHLWLLAFILHFPWVEVSNRNILLGYLHHMFL